MSRMTVPSGQDWGTIEQAKALIDEFASAVERFDQEKWEPFAAELKEMSLF